MAREALRLRARWVQELTARAAWELGCRLVCVGVLPGQPEVRLLGLDELRAAAIERTVPGRPGRPHRPGRHPPKPLPARFRLTDDHTPVAVASPATGAAGSAPAAARASARPTSAATRPRERSWW